MRTIPAGLLAGGAVLAAAALGARHGPQHPRTAIWYASLRKPNFTPPGPVFGVAWSLLDVLLGIAGARLLAAPPGAARNLALAGWSLNLAGLAGYPWVFFGRKRVDAATAVVGAMLANAAATTAAAARADRPAALATAPLVLWLGFAGLLSAEISRRN